LLPERECHTGCCVACWTSATLFAAELIYNKRLSKAATVLLLHMHVELDGEGPAPICSKDVGIHLTQLYGHNSIGSTTI